MEPDALPVKYSIVVPVYANEGTLDQCIERLTEVAAHLPGRLEVVFVVDGSPDGSLLELQNLLPRAGLISQLVTHSRNFGAFAAIRTGLGVARGDFIGVMAADLQEPPELMEQFFVILQSGAANVTVGKRVSRSDPKFSAVLSRIFWGTYRRTINRDIPSGGVDVFACSRQVAEHLLSLNEAHSSLVGLLYWTGFRRVEVPYSRSERSVGKSGWTFKKKYRYLLDSVFSFTDLPIGFLTSVGFFGGLLTFIASVGVLVSKLTGRIDVVGYAPLILAILFSTFTLLLGLGIVGSYVWRTFENSKNRPSAIVDSVTKFESGH